jgi:hypothetical protein
LRNPLREICTVGSVGGAPGNRRIYPEGIDSRCPTGLEDRKTLAPQRVKGMRDLRPSQIGAATMCI